MSSLRGALRSRPTERQMPRIVHRASARVRANVPPVEALLARLDPTLSLHRVLARVVEVRDETHDVKTYVLRPNARFRGFRAGSYVMVHLTIGGQRVQRAYSLSSAPSRAGLLEITVKRVPGGLVSNHLADRVAPGDVLELSAAQGQFVLPSRVPERLLMISAGSGITPVMSMLRELVARGSEAEVTFLHFARSPRDVIFGRELEEIARNVSGVRVVVCVEEGDETWTGPRGRFSAELLEQVAPGFRGSETYLCGPSGFMKAVMQAFERAGADLSRLRYERFGGDFDVSAFLEQSSLVRFVRSGVEAISGRPLTILQEAEARGVRVESGCRAGTCGTCRCRKRKGVVVNVSTGKESGAGEEMIYACVSVPRGTVEVEL